MDEFFASPTMRIFVAPASKKTFTCLRRTQIARSQESGAPGGRSSHLQDLKPAKLTPLRVEGGGSS